MCDPRPYRLYLYKIQAGGIWPKVRASWPRLDHERSWLHPNFDMITESNDTSLLNNAAPVSAANENTVPRASAAPLMRIRPHERSYESHESFEDESSRDEHTESMGVRDMRQHLASPPYENKFIYKPSSGGSHSTWPPTVS